MAARARCCEARARGLIKGANSGRRVALRGTRYRGGAWALLRRAMLSQFNPFPGDNGGAMGMSTPVRFTAAAKLWRAYLQAIDPILLDPDDVRRHLGAEVEARLRQLDLSLEYSEPLLESLLESMRPDPEFHKLWSQFNEGKLSEHDYKSAIAAQLKRRPDFPMIRSSAFDCSRKPSTLSHGDCGKS